MVTSLNPPKESLLVTVCARGGSKGVPNKNLRLIDGKPLIVHTLEHAQEWAGNHPIVVSTDSDEIAQVARDAGAQVPFDRPDELATDTAAKLPVLQHAVRKSESHFGNRYSTILDLDPTTPLRNVSDIEDCYQVFRANPEAKNAYTVYRSQKSPYFNMVELDENGYAHLSKDLDESVQRRQDSPTVYSMNASVYVYDRNFLLNTSRIHSDRTVVSVMPPERSVDIDRPLDFKFVKFLMESDSLD